MGVFLYYFVNLKAERSLCWFSQILQNNIKTGGCLCKFTYERNHPLNAEPIVIDFIVTRENLDVPVETNFGRIFRKYNIFEFKSPTAPLDIDVFFKVNAYACLYKAYGSGVDSVGMDEITVTFIRDIKPVKLFADLKKHGFSVENRYPGIYYIHGKQFFPTQILVGREMSKDENPWLRCMTTKATKEDLHRLLKEYHDARDEADRQRISAIIRVLSLANKGIFAEVWEEKYMLEELMEAVGLDKIIAEKNKEIVEMENQLADKDRDIAEKNSLIEKLMMENAALKAAQ